jgi:hypothetical protein
MLSSGDFNPEIWGGSAPARGGAGGFLPAPKGRSKSTLRSWFSPDAAGHRRNRGRDGVYIITVILSRLFHGFLNIISKIPLWGRLKYKHKYIYVHKLLVAGG